MTPKNQTRPFRWAAALFAAILTLAFCVPAAYAAEGDTGATPDGFVWREMAGGAIVITGYSGAGGSISVPPSINSLPVTQLDADSFISINTITAVDIPSTISSIGDEAFLLCTNLSSVTLHTGLHTIGRSAFLGTALTSVDIPSSVTAIGSNAFSQCFSLASVTLHEGLQTIGNNAFLSDTALTGINIPSTVSAIGEEAFIYCNNLSSVTLHDGLQSIGRSAFLSTALTEIFIPSTVTAIGNHAFYDCNSLASVTLSEGLQSIGIGVFYRTALTSATIPSTVTAIGDGAFDACPALTRAVVLSPAAAFGSSVFAPATLTDGIYGFSGSTAQAYALANSLPFGLIHTISFETNGSAALGDVFVCAGDTLAAPTNPVRSEYFFSGWYTDSALTQAAAFPMTISADTTLHAKWTALTLTLSPADGRVYTGGRVVITPSVSGGSWSFSSALLSRNGITFTALAAGTASVTYTVGDVAISADVVITASELPSTGQDYTLPLALAGAAALTLGAVFLVRAKRHIARR